MHWKKKVTLITFLVLLSVVSFINFKMFAPFLLSMAMGGLLALLMYPLYRRVRRRLSPRWASAVACLLLILVVLIPVGVFTVMAVDQGVAFTQKLASLPGVPLRDQVARLMRWEPLQTMFGSPEAVDEQMRSAIQKVGQVVSGWILAVAAAFPTLILDLILAVITCFFLLSDGRAFLTWLRDKIPMDDDVRDKLYGALRRASLQVIWAGVLASLVQAVIMFFTFLFLGLPAAFLAGGATFILAWIPVMGSSLVWIVGAIYLYTQGSIARMLILITLGLLNGVLDNVVRSRAMGGEGGMHPLVSLVAIFGGVQMFGIAGLFLGPIFAAILLAILQIWPVLGNRFGLAEASA